MQHLETNWSDRNLWKLSGSVNLSTSVDKGGRGRSTSVSSSGENRTFSAKALDRQNRHYRIGLVMGAVFGAFVVGTGAIIYLLSQRSLVEIPGTVEQFWADASALNRMQLYAAMETELGLGQLAKHLQMLAGSGSAQWTREQWLTFITGLDWTSQTPGYKIWSFVVSQGGEYLADLTHYCTLSPVNLDLTLKINQFILDRTAKDLLEVYSGAVLEEVFGVGRLLWPWHISFSKRSFAWVGLQVLPRPPFAP